MLKIDNINLYYDGIHALKGVSLEVPEGKIISLIGANGAGKTSTLRTISGLNKPKSGTIIYNNQDLLKVSPEKLVNMGIIHVPEGRRIFAPMSVYENLELGAYLRKDKAGIEKDLQNVFKRFPRLEERKKQTAGTLSGGEQQMLAMGRALMAQPKVLLLDEPSMGLAPILVREIFDIIKELNSIGITILLVEQNAKMALSIADYAYVLETGKIVLEGKGKDLADSDEIQKAYLGG